MRQRHRAPRSARRGSRRDPSALADSLRSYDPANHDVDADLYANDIPLIWAGLLTFDANFTPIPDCSEINGDATMWNTSYIEGRK